MVASIIFVVLTISYTPLRQCPCLTVCPSSSAPSPAHGTHGKTGKGSRGICTSGMMGDDEQAKCVAGLTHSERSPYSSYSY